MKYIGLDYGSKRIGVAVSDVNGGFAFPEAVTESRAQLWRVIERLIGDGAGVIVVGDGRALNGGANAITADTDAFADECAQRFPQLSVVRSNEAWSSQEAARYAPPHKRHNDSAAAAIILQRYLDTTPSRGTK